MVGELEQQLDQQRKDAGKLYASDPVVTTIKSLTEKYEPIIQEEEVTRAKL